MRQSFQQTIESELEQLRSLQRFRRREVMPASPSCPTSDSEAMVDFASNDYLGLSRHRRLVLTMRKAAKRWGCGAGASSLVTGYLRIHQQVEETVADWLGRETCLLFGSGYLANIGILTAVADKDTQVFADRKVHASIIDGVRQSGAKLFRYQTADAQSLERMLKKQRQSNTRKIIVTESVFSMDGHLAPLETIAVLAREHADLFILDEAHAVGIFGREGNGLASELPDALAPDLILGTGGKALGSYGAFVACSALLRDYLINRSRSLIYSTAIPPPVAATLEEAVRMLQEQSPPNAWGKELQERSLDFRRQLREKGMEVPLDRSPIVPIVVGDDRDALDLAQSLQLEGHQTVPIRPPTVPEGTSRLRISLSLRHTENQLEKLIQSLQRHWR